MRDSTKLLLVGAMSASLPVMAATGAFSGAFEEAISIGDDAGFISPVAQSRCSPDGYGGCEIVVTGDPFGGDSTGTGGGGGSGIGGTGLAEGDASIQPGEAPSEPNRIQCKFGNGGDVNVTFDGRTIWVTAKYRLEGEGAAASVGYIAGIEERWTKDFGDIAVSTDLTPDVNGFVVRVFGGIWAEPRSVNNGFPYMDVEVGTGHWRINLGSLSGVSGEALKISLNMAAHEFGHFFFNDNKNPIPNDPDPSIMADGYLGRVKPEDLRDVVRFCRSQQ